MGNAELDKELREIGIAIAGIEIATWAAMRALFEVNPQAAAMLQEISPALLSGLKGGASAEVRAKAEVHINRWCPTT